MRRERRVRERNHAGGGLVDSRIGVVVGQLAIPTAQMPTENRRHTDPVAHTQIHVGASMMAPIHAVDVALTGRSPTAGVVTFERRTSRFTQQRHCGGTKRVAGEVPAVIAPERNKEVVGFFLAKCGYRKLEGTLEGVRGQSTGLE